MKHIRLKIRSEFKQFFPYLFGVVFFASGFYSLPFLELDVQLVVIIKRFLFGGFMLALALSIAWEQVRVDAFSWLCILWGIVNLISYSIHGGNPDVYLLRLAQISFVWLFVIFLRQQAAPFELVQFQKWFSPGLVSIVAVVFLLGCYSAEGAKILAGGFGNNRVNFSIWCSQLVFVILLMSSKGSKISAHSFAKALLTASPVILLQVFSGARTGVLVSIVLCLYFVYYFVSLKATIQVLSWFSLVLCLGALVSPLQELYPGTALARATDMVELRSWGQGDWLGFFHWLDRFSSYRLGISVDAVKSLDGVDLLIGRGIGNFQGYAIGQMWDVHNIYLRGLGELGVLGALILVALVVLPLKCAPARQEDKFARFFCVCMLLVGLIHPEFINTAISTCLMYWVAYAQLKEPSSSERAAVCEVHMAVSK